MPAPFSQIAPTERFFALTYAGDIVTVRCQLCAGFELLIERNARGEKMARDRAGLHLRAVHECRAC